MILTEARYGYDAGTQLRDVTLAEARAMECNRCGDCCNGLSEYVRTDEATGLPLMVWGSQYPVDLYESRYGQRMLQPVCMTDGGIGIGEDFEVDVDGKPHTSFQCAFWRDGDPSSCGLYRNEPNPADLSTIRPRNCGDFPVYGIMVDDTIIAGHSFVPAVGALPRCTWYGIRVVGPWRDTPMWRERWEKQQRGEPVPEIQVPESFIAALAAREARNGKQLQDL